MTTTLIRIIVVFALLGLTSAQSRADYDDIVFGLLADFYHALGGDDWHNKDGWLDPEIHYCAWYGIYCQHPNDSPRLGQLVLRNNNLHGEFPRDNDLFMGFFARLGINLSDNSISGTPIISKFTTNLNLANNQLGGSLEEAIWPPPDLVIDPPPPQRLRRLNLSGNALDGDIPDWLAEIRLDSLDLSDNQFSGGAESAFASVALATRANLNLSNNPLAETIPQWIVDIDFSPFHGATFGIGMGGLNLCWTGLAIPDESLGDFIAAHHRGGEVYDLCLGREGLPLDPALSGSWFDPTRAGEGLTMMLLENEQVLTYWFSHLSRERQAWFFNVGKQDDVRLVTPHLLRTRGQFGQGFGDVDTPMRPAGGLTLSRVAEDRLVAEFDLIYTNRDFETDLQLGAVIPFPVYSLQNYIRLSQLAGTRCDHQSSWQRLSGLWHDPERAGEGFLVEVLSDSRALVYWFTHTPDGSGEQAWMIGDVEILAGTPGGSPPAQGSFARLSGDLLQPISTLAELSTDLLQVELVNWGELSIEFFHDDATARIDFSSELEEFGSGSYFIERLARPMLAECEDPADLAP